MGDQGSYMDLVEKLVVGPAPLRASHMEHLLGINPDLFSRASQKRVLQNATCRSWNFYPLLCCIAFEIDEMKGNEKGRGNIVDLKYFS